MVNNKDKIIDNRYLINYDINFEKIRLIDINGKQLGIFYTKDAIKKYKKEDLDLVLINKNINPPICKIINYNKYIYNKNKFLKNLKKKQSFIQIKEIQMKLNIDNNDYLIKLKKIRNFLNKKNRVKIIIKFSGREIVHNSIGFSLFKKIYEELDDICKIHFISNKIEDKQIIMILSSKN
ncbi:translation initiation factor IF-3 [endosymbiont of Euscepes postfasciatus]|uniref:translation initiation factor IF-3 n=1 Tax=endosymbiont of Euscepes postfasciatus TaxID=650377 RepID=UPI000DC6D7C4|nr:translation initiation factor IF-3 [endosymbiont of Euscepes postfasciatus]BBA84659.1 translation initiation factor IF-3 [endosymbiont of Euscepes postfasciatus]